MKLKVFIDGLDVQIPVRNDVKVIIEEADEDHPEVQIHQTFTYEGVIRDYVTNDCVMDGPAEEYEIPESVIAQFEEEYDE